MDKNNFKKIIKQTVVKEMFDLTLEPLYKKLDKVSNETGKQKLVYQWVKQGHIDFKTYLKLSKYLQQDVNI